MKPRIIRLLLASTALTAIGAALFVIQPWDSGEDAPVAAAFGLCNVSLESMPDGVDVTAVPVPHQSESASPGAAYKAYLILSAPLQANAVSITNPRSRSHVAIDPTSGEVETEFYLTPDDEALLTDVTEQLQVGPWELAPTAEILDFPASWHC